jgi:chromosome partitioning protein
MTQNDSQVWVVGGQKGGTGKSTTAQNLAVASALDNEDVVLIDTDSPQNTSSNWSDERAAADLKPAVYCVVKTGRGVGAVIDDLRRRYSRVIVDAGAADTEELRMSVVRADILIAPLQPSQADLWTISKVDQITQEARSINAKLRALVVLTRVPADPRVPETKAAIELLKEFPDLKLAHATLCERVAYKRALASGRGVLDYEPADDKAIAELKQLYSEIGTWLGQ